MSKKSKPFLAHSEITDCIYIIDGNTKYDVTEQCIKAMKATNRMQRDDMTDKERIERITKLVDELDLDDITSAEFDEMFPKQSINDLKDELWRMYCFAEDVRDMINMK